MGSKVYGLGFRLRFRRFEGFIGVYMGSKV